VQIFLIEQLVILFFVQMILIEQLMIIDFGPNDIDEAANNFE
jgi:hypothetical protein